MEWGECSVDFNSYFCKLSGLRKSFFIAASSISITSDLHGFLKFLNDSLKKQRAEICLHSIFEALHFNPLSDNPTKWSNTLKQFAFNSLQIVWVCLAILQGWGLKS